MSIHQLRLQFTGSYWDVLKDLYKLEALEEHNIPPDDVTHDLEEHLAAHTATTLQVARFTSPTKTRPLPVCHL